MFFQKDNLKNKKPHPQYHQLTYNSMSTVLNLLYPSLLLYFNLNINMAQNYHKINGLHLHSYIVLNLVFVVMDNYYNYLLTLHYIFMTYINTFTDLLLYS